MQTSIIFSFSFFIRLHVINSFHQFSGSFILQWTFSINLPIPQASSNFQVIQGKQLLTWLLKNYKDNHTDMQAHYLKSPIDTAPKYPTEFLNLVKCRTSMAFWSWWSGFLLFLFLLNVLGKHWLINLYRFQVPNSTTHHLYMVSCVQHPKSSIHPSPLIPLPPFYTSSPPWTDTNFQLYCSREKKSRSHSLTRKIRSATLICHEINLYLWNFFPMHFVWN